jgi:hypothetical protein
MILNLDTSGKNPKLSEWMLKSGNNSTSIPVLFFYDMFGIGVSSESKPSNSYRMGASSLRNNCFRSALKICTSFGSYGIIPAHMLSMERHLTFCLRPLHYPNLIVPDRRYSIILIVHHVPRSTFLILTRALGNSSSPCSQSRQISEMARAKSRQHVWE